MYENSAMVPELEDCIWSFHLWPIEDWIFRSKVDLSLRLVQLSYVVFYFRFHFAEPSLLGCTVMSIQGFLFDFEVVDVHVTKITGLGYCLARVLFEIFPILAMEVRNLRIGLVPPVERTFKWQLWRTEISFVAFVARMPNFLINEGVAFALSEGLVSTNVEHSCTARILFNQRVVMLRSPL